MCAYKLLKGIGISCLVFLVVLGVLLLSSIFLRLACVHHRFFQSSFASFILFGVRGGQGCDTKDQCLVFCYFLPGNGRSSGVALHKKRFPTTRHRIISILTRERISEGITPGGNRVTKNVPSLVYYFNAGVSKTDLNTRTERKHTASASSNHLTVAVVPGSAPVQATYRSATSPSY